MVALWRDGILLGPRLTPLDVTSVDEFMAKIGENGVAQYRQRRQPLMQDGWLYCSDAGGTSSASCRRKKKLARS